MKNSYYLIIICGILVMTGCDKDDSLSANIIEDDAFKSYLLQNFDTDKDGKFSKAEIAAVKTIDVNNMGITSIKGIEAFNAIETLKCNNNKIKDIDVTKNRALVYLDCSYNEINPFLRTPMVGKMKYLDQSNNKGILFYDSSGEKGLEYLDVSNAGYSDGIYRLPQLKYLNCSKTGMHSLFVSSCTELVHLDFSENEMNENMPVDLTKNTKLNELWASKNPGLKYIHLKQGHKIDDLKIDDHVEIVYK